MRVVIHLDSPLQHGAFGESAGNATLCRRMTVVSLPDRPRVPCLSGNALRGVMRRTVMRDLLERSGVRPVLPPGIWDRLYAAIANGGHLEAAETAIRPDEIRALRESLPPLSLFGAALYSYLLPGHMDVGIAWLRCRETVEAGLSAGPTEAYAEDLVEEISHCRHVDREMQEPEVSGVTPMPTTLEVICAGAALETSIRFAAHAGAIEESCAAWALDRITALGGKSSAGLGHVRVEHDGDGSAYQAWLDETADLADRLVTLAGQLGQRAAKKAKPARKGGQSASPARAS